MTPPMLLDPATRVEKFNSLVRGVVTLALTFGFVYGFIVSKVVSVEAYIGIFGAVVAWWFATRHQQNRSTDNAAPKSGTPSPP